MRPTDFTCMLCDEEKREALPRWISEERSERICDECAGESIVPLFQEAMMHEHTYPPRWGREKLEYWTFQDLLDEDEKDEWGAKVREYETPVEKRLYCCHRDEQSGEVCEMFLGEKGEGAVVCPGCAGSTCRSCKATWHEYVGGLDEHMCETMHEEDPFEDMIKGKDYQQCPGCKKNIAQGDGCNHMICACRVNFCFICGQEVAANLSGHWRVGGCPRWGHDTGDIGSYDDPGFDSDEEEDLDDHVGAALAAQLARRRRLEVRYAFLRDFFNQQDLGEARQIRNAANRRYLLPGWFVNAEARRDLFRAVSSNMVLALRVVAPHFNINQDEDVEGTLAEFEIRHRTIDSDYRAALRTNQEDEDEVQISNMQLEFEMYYEAAESTIQDLGDRQ